MTNGRAKGKAFEREVANLIKDHTGFDVKRNLMQTAEGGHDLLGVPGFAIECKRYASVKHGDLLKFWQQTVKQARQISQTPCLIVKEDRQPIRVYIVWTGILGMGAYDWDDFNCTAGISMELFCAILTDGVDQSVDG